MKERIVSGILFMLCTLVLISLSSCQDVFTYSPLQFLQRDPENLPDKQKVKYAEDMLANGSQKDMKDAYKLVEDMLKDDPDNAELHLLAADLAIGASGINDAVSSIDPSSGGGSYDDILKDLDTDMLDEVGGHVEAAESSGADVSDSQYVNASMAIVASEAKEKGGFDNIDWENPNDDIQQAKDFADKGGVDIESLTTTSE
jgi:hypothetical protein